MIWVSGSIARDVIMDFPGKFAEHIDPKKVHILSLSFAVKNLKENFGGTAANICHNLGLLNEQSSIIGNVGADAPDIARRLKDLHIDIRYLRILKKHTATAYIITDQDDNQITGFHAGAMFTIGRLPQKAAGPDWAIIAAEDPQNMVRLAKFYQKRKVQYIFDPGQQITALSNQDLVAGIGGAAILIGNDYEIGLIGKRLPRFSRPRKSWQWDVIVVRTLGPKGSEIVVPGGKRIKIGIAKPKLVLDPTGAGDAYRAGFLKGLVLGYDLNACGQLAATVASFAVEKYGTQNHKFTRQDIIKRYKRNFGGEIN